MRRVTWVSLALWAGPGGCNGKLAVTGTRDGSGGAADARGGDAGGPMEENGGTPTRGGSQGAGSGQGGSSGGLLHEGGSSVGGNGGSGDSEAGGADLGEAGQYGTGAVGGAMGGTTSIDDCTDQVRDGNETDIDCGGPQCPACGAGSVCTRITDCASRVCRGNRCLSPTCDDGVQNGDETGIDCGGSCTQGPQGGNCKVTLRNCDCASTALLSPIACGVTADPNLDSAYLDATGDTAALALCNGTACDAHRWSRKEGVTLLAQAGRVAGISQDGRAVLVTLGDSPNPQAILWQVGDIRSAIPGADARGLSADGTTVLVSDGHRFGRWTSARGVTLLGSATDLSFHGSPVMTPDAAVVVGQREPLGSDSGLVMWNSAGDERSFGTTPDGGLVASAEVVSADGRVVAGTWLGFAGAAHLYRWSNESDLVTLADAPVGGIYRRPRLNADGSVLLGNYQPRWDVPSVAFRWTEANGSSDFANSPPEGSVMEAASADGSVAIGFTLQSESRPPFVWDATNGMRPLRSVLEEAQVDVDSWELVKLLALSRDGKVVLGEGICRGVPAIFRAVLP